MTPRKSFLCSYAGVRSILLVLAVWGLMSATAGWTKDDGIVGVLGATKPIRAVAAGPAVKETGLLAALNPSLTRHSAAWLASSFLELDGPLGYSNVSGGAVLSACGNTVYMANVPGVYIGQGRFGYYSWLDTRGTYVGPTGSIGGIALVETGFIEGAYFYPVSGMYVPVKGKVITNVTVVVNGRVKISSSLRMSGKAVDSTGSKYVFSLSLREKTVANWDWSWLDNNSGPESAFIGRSTVRAPGVIVSRGVHAMAGLPINDASYYVNSMAPRNLKATKWLGDVSYQDVFLSQSGGISRMTLTYATSKRIGKASLSLKVGRYRAGAAGLHGIFDPGSVPVSAFEDALYPTSVRLVKPAASYKLKIPSYVYFE